MTENEIAKFIVANLAASIERGRAVVNLMLPSDVAYALGITKAAVKKLTNSGELTHVMIDGQVRYAPADVAAFIVRNTSPAKAELADPKPASVERFAL